MIPIQPDVSQVLTRLRDHPRNIPCQGGVFRNIFEGYGEHVKGVSVINGQAPRMLAPVNPLGDKNRGGRRPTKSRLAEPPEGVP